LPDFFPKSLFFKLEVDLIELDEDNLFVALPAVTGLLGTFSTAGGLVWVKVWSILGPAPADTSESSTQETLGLTTPAPSSEAFFFKADP
jgi:hypothetical protein